MGYFDEVGARIPKSNPDFDLDTYKQANGYGRRVLWGPFKGERQLEDDEK